jgi:hypothetical protein
MVISIIPYILYLLWIFCFSVVFFRVIILKILGILGRFYFTNTFMNDEIVMSDQSRFLIFSKLL